VGRANNFMPFTACGRGFTAVEATATLYVRKKGPCNNLAADAVYAGIET
jgi:hypothetical protein